MAPAHGPDKTTNTRTVGELILALREAHRLMGVNNPHRAVVGQAAFALVYLSQQVEHLKAGEPKPTERRIVLTGEGAA